MHYTSGVTASELDRITAMAPRARLEAVVGYIHRAEMKLREARVVRDRAINELGRDGGTPRREVAELSATSLAHVSQVLRAFDLAGVDHA